MRSAGWLVCAVLVLVLGAIQILGSVAVRSSAQRGAWVRLVPDAIERRVDELDTPFPLPAALWIVLARHAVERGDLARALRDAQHLNASAERLGIEARVAEARQDMASAAAAYLAAGDFAAVQRMADARARRGDVAGGLALERAAIARLRDDRTQADALAEAYLHLGRFQQARAYDFSGGSPAQRDDERRAADSYARAVALAPLSVRYLIALGNQQLNLAEIDAAQRTFVRARDVDPTSAEPIVGLGDAALRRHDLRAAQSYLARARALDPASIAVARLARAIGM